MEAMDTIRAVVKQSRNRKFEEAEYHVGELQKNVADQRNTLSSLVATEKESLSELEKEVKEQRNSISLLQKEVTDLRKAHDTLSTLAQDVAQLKEWRLSEERQELITRLSKVEAALSEGTVRVEHADVEIPEPSDKSDKVLTTKEYAMAAIASQRTYSFQESVYDAAFFAFTQHLGCMYSVFACIGFVLNVALQGGVIYTLVTQFTTDPFEGDFMQRLTQWRQSEGHSYRNADPLTGVSLTARVCDQDSSLSLAAGQVGIIGDAKDYLDNGSGFLLCAVAITLWQLTCAFELRMTIQFFLSLLSLRVTGGSRTEFFADSDGLQVVGLSCARLLIGFIIALIRSSVAVLLLIYGSWWLAYTASVKDLLLNASALGFVLDIDEIVFGVISPATLTGLIDSLQPLRLPKRLFILNVLMMLGVTASVILMEVLFSQYTRGGLQDAMDILCDPENTNLNFITGATEAGWLVYASSVHIDDRLTNAIVAKRRSSEYLIEKNTRASLYARDVSGDDISRNLVRVQRLAGQPYDDIINDQACLDMSGPQLGGNLYAITGIKAMEDIISCDEVTALCKGYNADMTARAVRISCPIKCGCADPTSGMWSLAGPLAGCPWKSCSLTVTKLTSQTGSGYKCEDTPLSELQLNPNWTSMLDLMNESNHINTSVFSNLSSIGCPAFASLQYAKRKVLCGLSAPADWDSDSVFLGAGFMCPESCSCVYPFEEEPEVEDPDVKIYHPADAGLCPREACWKKYFDDADVKCAARNLTTYWFETSTGRDLFCDV